MISVRPNDSGDKLVIKSFVTEHNHIRSEVSKCLAIFLYNLSHNMLLLGDV